MSETFGEPAQSASGVVHNITHRYAFAGFDERHPDTIEAVEAELWNTVDVAPEDMSTDDLRAYLEASHADRLRLLGAVQTLDDYLHNHAWNYEDEREDEEQKEVLQDILSGLSAGYPEGFAESPTSTGKSRIIAKLAEAFHLGGLRVLVLAPTKTIGEQLVGDMDPEETKGLTRHAPLIDASLIARHFGNDHAKPTDPIVISTYQSLNRFAKSGALGTFDVVLADEAHRGLGEQTSKSLKTFSPGAIKIGLTATPYFGSNKSVDQVFSEKMHSMSFREAIEKDKVAPVHCLTYSTGESIELLDSSLPDFTVRELQKLINLKTRNEKAIQFAHDFVKDGRQGIITCLPGNDLAHAKLIAEQLSQITVIDKQSGETRYIVAKAIGGSMSDQERFQLLADYRNGKVDVLTFVNVLSEGWDSQAASFLINTCPTTSLVKITQQIGRVIRKKPGNLSSVIVDFIDDATAKEQMTALHVLGETEINLGKVYGSSASQSENGGHNYLRGILDIDLYKTLLVNEGKLISDLTIPAKDRLSKEELARQQEQERIRKESEKWEKILGKAGLSMEGPQIVPDRFLIPVQQFERKYLDEHGVYPVETEIVQYLRVSGLGTVNTRFNIAKAAMIALRIELVDPSSAEYVSVEDEDVRQEFEHVEKHTDLQEGLRTAFEALNEREQAILVQRFGIGGNKPKTHEEVGFEFNLTRERIRQIETKAMVKLRDTPSSSRHLRSLVGLPDLSTYFQTLATSTENGDEADFNPVVNPELFNRWIRTLQEGERFAPLVRKSETQEPGSPAKPRVPFGLDLPRDSAEYHQYQQELAHALDDIHTFANIYEKHFGSFSLWSYRYDRDGKRAFNELFNEQTPFLAGRWDLKRRIAERYDEILEKLKLRGDGTLGRTVTELLRARRQILEEEFGEYVGET